MQDIRKLVYNSLLSCEENSRYSNLELDSVLKRNSDLQSKDRSFYTALFYGVTERKITLDYQIIKLTGKQTAKFEIKTLILLRMGIYQILFMDSVPDHAAVNETVKLAKKEVNPGALGLINAVLRNASVKLKDKMGNLNLITPDKTRDICGYLSIYYGFPRYLCKIWVNAYGEENAEKIMISLNRKSKTSIRVNTLKISREKYLYMLNMEGYDASPSEITSDGILLSGGNVTKLPGFDEGLFFIQDDASAMACAALSPRPDDFLIDTCACPGGKSFLCAIYMENKGKILSLDVHSNKLSLIESGAKRLGLDIIKTGYNDASVLREDLISKADVVLCDVPCSGFGTISKKPDLRNKTKESISLLPALQYSILETCSKYVKKGGKLMYSTCTLNPAENEENIRSFLTLNNGFKLENMVTNFPFESLSDGFFYAVLHRI